MKPEYQNLLDLKKQATPTPWEFNDAGHPAMSLYGPDNFGLWHAKRSDEEGRANGAYIVACCNLAPQLVRELEAESKAHESTIDDLEVVEAERDTATEAMDHLLETNLGLVNQRDAALAEVERLRAIAGPALVHVIANTDICRCGPNYQCVKCHAQEALAALSPATEK